MRCLVVVAFAACTPSVPGAPSFQQDVAPILAANCIRCHGYPAIGGAPEYFRLDSYGDLPLSDDPDLTIDGVATQAPLIAERVASTDMPMPPRFGLDDYQIETLVRWAAGADRGAPRSNNQPPVVTGSVDLAQLVASVRVDDADDSLVAGELRLVSATADRFVGLVRTGSLSFAIDPALVADAGTYRLVARVDDGAEPAVIEVAAFEVTP